MLQLSCDGFAFFGKFTVQQHKKTACKMFVFGKANARPIQ